MAGWILELDRGQGIPFEGNYSEWLKAKDERLRMEEKEQSALQKTIQSEVRLRMEEWVHHYTTGQLTGSIFCTCWQFAPGVRYGV